LRERLTARAHRKAALDRFVPRPGSLDEAQRPLDFVQIDYTKFDVIVVDEEQSLPIGRPGGCGYRRIAASGEVLEGSPADEIVRRAREGGFDLIIAITHGRQVEPA
jgi:nucleotide-binding universal stress UspA family protein